MFFNRAHHALIVVDFLSYVFGYLLNLSGLKVCETNENELVMEPAFRWAGNPNIVLVLKLLSLRIKIQVRNLGHNY